MLEQTLKTGEVILPKGKQLKSKELIDEVIKIRNVMIKADPDRFRTYEQEAGA